VFGSGSTNAAPRDVQIVAIDFETEVVELHNFGATAQNLSGWQFCSHDENQTFQYSLRSGLNGVVVDAASSLFIHFANDAPAEAGHRNRPSGSFALPLDRGPYALGLYFSPVNFSNGNTIADHVQWSLDGVDNRSADERSDEAESGGVWTNQSLWAITDVDSVSLELAVSSEGLVLHGPEDYRALPEPSPSTLLFAGLLTTAARRRARRRAGTERAS